MGMSKVMVGFTCLAALSIFTTPVFADDFGAKTEKKLQKQSKKWFGFKKPLTASAPATVGAVRAPGQKAKEHVLLAKGLKAHYLTREAGDKADQFNFWPDEYNPTHAIFCIEGGRELIGSFSNGRDKYNPAVQRINLFTGTVETILRGISRCDGLRRTPWGTILATEETSDGGAYEILSPLSTTNHTVTDRSLGTVVDINGNPSSVVRKQTALPVIAWEGIGILESGVVYAGDELRPGTGTDDSDGGAIFKFVPQNLHVGGVITQLSQSPLANGMTYAFQTSCRDDRQQFGQGCEIGNGVWVAVSASQARSDAHAWGATGYYRPEDGHVDPYYDGPGARFCWTNTGNRGASNYGEVMCMVDTEPNADPLAILDDDPRPVVVNRFMEGDPDFNAPDNLAFQPVTGNIFIIEDNPNGDIFACLRDEKDRNIKTDGCVKMLSVVDSSAEPTGFHFTGDGTKAIVSIQHSNDANMPKFDDYPTDDILMITGFKLNNID